MNINKFFETSTFFSYFLSLVVVFLIWLVKLAFDKYRNSRTAVGKIERAYIFNITSLESNSLLLDAWIKSLKIHNRYTCSFTKMITYDDEIGNLGDINILKIVLKDSFLFKALNDDISTIYSFYRDMDIRLMDKTISEEIFKGFCDNLVPQLEYVYDRMVKEPQNLLPNLAHVQLFALNRSKYSLFGIIDYVINKDVFPVISKKRIDKRVDKIKKSILKEDDNNAGSK